MRRTVIIFLLQGVCCVLSLYEGDACSDDKGFSGICRNVPSCSSAVEALKKHQQPPMCTFDGDVPIVCCVQKKAASPPTKRPLTTTTEYTPEEEVYVRIREDNECRPLRNFTIESTDRISWKKCLQYQEELVYPCKLDALGNKVRVNNCKHSASQLILGGVNAAETEFPHMVMLSFNKEIDFFESECGATLISDWFMLTAGHCTYKKRVGEVQYGAVGALKQSSIIKSRIYKIADRIQHPKYSPNYHYYDLALLKTETRVKLDMFVVPACLDLANDVTDAEALATGWGATVDGGNPVDHLQKVVLQKFSVQQCSRHFVKDRRLPVGFRPDILMCYGDNDESKDACSGDSGGPLQVKLQRATCMYSIIGVTSFGRHCGVIGRPGVYTRVLPVVSWIEGIVWPNE